MIVKSWASTQLRVNGIEIRVTTEIGHLINYLFEKNNRKDTYYTKSVIRGENTVQSATHFS